MKQIIFLFGTLLMFSCGKDKFNTKPTLKFKSVNSKVINRNDDLKMELNVTDLEGDLTDSIFVFRRVKNCTFSNRNEKYAFPVYPTKTNLDIDVLVAYTYNTSQMPYPALLAPQCSNRNDTAIFRFVVKDKAGNVSDTVNSETIVIKQ